MLAARLYGNLSLHIAILISLMSESTAQLCFIAVAQHAINHPNILLAALTGEQGNSSPLCPCMGSNYDPLINFVGWAILLYIA